MTGCPTAIAASFLPEVFAQALPDPWLLPRFVEAGAIPP